MQNPARLTAQRFIAIHPPCTATEDEAALRSTVYPPQCCYGGRATADRQGLDQPGLAAGSESNLAYWRGQLENLPRLGLSSLRSRQQRQTLRDAATQFFLKPAMCEALGRIGATRDADLFMVLLAALKCLLFRYTGQTDIAVGSYLRASSHATLSGDEWHVTSDVGAPSLVTRHLSPGKVAWNDEDELGFGSNLVLLRTRFLEDVSFLNLLEQVRQVVLEARAHGTVDECRGRSGEGVLQSTVHGPQSTVHTPRSTLHGRAPADCGLWTVDCGLAHSRRHPGDADAG